MEIGLLEAAYTGNTQQLQQILKESPLILHRIPLVSSENPLHVASMAGHVDFVKEVVTLKPDLAKELNQDGFSPLHLASANGYVEVVRELIRADQSLCRIRGREGITALHVAAIRGKVDVLWELLSACPDCIEDVTVQRETALHLAIKYNQFEALKAVVEWAKEMEKAKLVLNMKDAQDNTILHLATWKKQFQVVDLLLGNGTTNSSLLEINGINQSGMTALDLLLIFPSEAGDREIMDTLQSAGSMTAKDLLSATHSSEFHSQTTQDHQATSQTRRRSKTDDLVEFFKFKRGRDSPSDARTSLLVISVFVATTTFQVGLNPPGGVWQDSGGPSNGTVNQTVEQIAGRSIFGSQDIVWFTIFVIFNTIGFTMSLSMVSILTKNFPLKLELEICMIAMYVTYGIAVGCVSPTNINTLLTVLTSTLPTLLPFGVTWFLRSQISKIRGLFLLKMSRLRS